MPETNGIGVKGWGRPFQAKKWHYFINKRSLCGKWVFFSLGLDDSPHTSPDNCVACERARAKREKAKHTPDL